MPDGECADAISPTIVPTVTRKPRMQGFPPITSGFRVILLSCFIILNYQAFWETRRLILGETGYKVIGVNLTQKTFVSFVYRLGQIPLNPP